MSDPVTWGLVISAATGAYAGYSSYQTASFNADIADKEATYQQQKGEVESEEAMKRMRIAMADAKVDAATSGLSLLSSSFESVFEETAEEGIFDALILKNNADNQVSSALSQKSLFGQQAGASLIKGGLGAGSTLLTEFKPKSTAEVR